MKRESKISRSRTTGTVRVPRISFRSGYGRQSKGGAQGRVSGSLEREAKYRLGNEAERTEIHFRQHWLNPNTMATGVAENGSHDRGETP